jgi:hypothetical protein
MSRKLSNALLLISWVPLLQLQGFSLIKYKMEPMNWFFLLTLVVTFIGVWLLIKWIPQKSEFPHTALKLISIVFFSIYLLGIPVFSCFGNIFKFYMHFYGETSPFPLIVSIISAGLLCIVLFLFWKEIQEEEKPYMPVLKFILASIFLLWQLNLGFHLYYHLPYGLGHSHYFPKFQDLLPILESFHIFKVPIFIFYIIPNLLFFGRIFLKGKFKERQNLFFSSTGLILVVGVFSLIFGLINLTQFLYFQLDATFFLAITFSFIMVIGPVLMIAMGLTLIGGLLSIFKKRLGRSGDRVPGRIRIIGVILTLAAVVLYVILFGAMWPFQNPAVNIHMGVLKKSWEGHPEEWLANTFGIAYYEFRLYGRSAGSQLINKLDDNSPIIRALAAEYLGYTGDERAVEPLLDALNDKDAGVVLQAVRALVEINEPRAIDILLNKLDHEDKEIRKEVVRSLNFFKDVRIVDKLIERLKTEKVRDVILEIHYQLYMLTGHGTPSPGEKENSAQWWQQWWNQHRQEFIKKWPTN